MPYIDRKQRSALNPLSARDAATPGELNFQFTMLVKRYVHNNDLDYQTINDVLGALEGAKQEFYRRVSAPYENFKLTFNGDVYDDD